MYLKLIKKYIIINKIPLNYDKQPIGLFWRVKMKHKLKVLTLIFLIFSFIKIEPVFADTMPTLNAIFDVYSSVGYVQLKFNKDPSSTDYYRAERSLNNQPYEPVASYVSPKIDDSIGDMLIGVPFGAICSYRLAIYDSSYNFKGYSNIVSFKSIESPQPKNVKSEYKDSGKVTISWTYNNETPNYTVIERKVLGERNASGEDIWTTVGSVAGNVSYFEDTTIESNKTYSYRLRAILGVNSFSKYVETSYVFTDLIAPNSPNVTIINDNTVMLEWDYIWSQAVDVVIERKDNNGEYKEIFVATSNQTQWIDTKLTKQFTYTYRIKARSKVFVSSSPYSEPKSILLIPVNAPNQISASATSNSSIKLTWADISLNETGYEIWRKVGENGAWTKYCVLPANTEYYVDLNLDYNTLYSYKIRAFSGMSNVYSYFTHEAYAKTLIPTSAVYLDYSMPSITSAKLQWTITQSNSEKVLTMLERKAEYDLEWSPIPSYSYSGSNYLDPVLKPYQRYQYRVKIIDQTSNSISYSNTIEFAPGTPNTPNNLDINPMGPATVMIKWDDTSFNEDGFIIERSVSGGSFYQIAKVDKDSTSYIDNMLSPDKMYYYRVYAINKSGVSTYSNQRYFVAKSPKFFLDMQDYNWASEAVINLTDLGILKGKTDILFAPQEYITRAEFTSLVIRALNLKAVPNSSFFDVSPYDWFYKDIMSAKSLGIISSDNGYFYPDSNLTREDMAVIIYKALQSANKPLKEHNNSILNMYEDKFDISDYAYPYMASLKGEGLLSGKSTTLIAPKDPLTRAEAATMLWRVLKN